MATRYIEKQFKARQCFSRYASNLRPASAPTTRTVRY